MTADVESAEVSLPLGFTGKKLDQCPTTLTLDSTFDMKMEYQVLTADVEFNAACRDFAECSLTCPCGDTACATADAEQHDSTLAVKLYE